MKKTLLPADELAIIHSEMKDLRDRAAQLQAAFLNHPDGGRHLGSWHDVEIVTQKTRVFNHAALPDHIRDDPTYWTVRETRTVRLCEPPSLPKPPSAEIFNLSDHQNMK